MKLFLGRAGAVVLALLLLGLGSGRPAAAGQELRASPLAAGCYIVRPERCKIHVDPFTLYAGGGKTLARFQLTAARTDGAPASVIYDFGAAADENERAAEGGGRGKPGGYTPSLVAQDFAAACGASYSVGLRAALGGDEGELSELGATATFTCPVWQAEPPPPPPPDLLFLPNIAR